MRVRQGYPLSPYLFLIAIEIMAISIRTNNQIEGIKIGDEETKSVLYADDMIATLANISPLGLEWCFGVKTLGIHFSCDQEQVIQQNFYDRLTECQKLIDLWKLRGLSLFGKVAIIKSFLLPKLLYVSSIIETPPEIIKQMERP